MVLYVFRFLEYDLLLILINLVARGLLMIVCMLQEKDYSQIRY